ncbi:MAG: ABC transporter substrate-binding protein [Microgenomates group bacterium]
MEPTQNQNIFPQQSVQGVPETQAPPVPVIPEPPAKKTLPKWAIWVAVGVVVLIVIILVVVRLFKPKSTATGEVTWWGLWEEEFVVAPLIAEYEQKNPKVKIKYVKQSPKDYRERLTNSLAKNQGPDIFRFHNSWVPMFAKDLDTLPSSVMTASDFSKTFYPVASSDLTTASGIVGIPLEYDALVLYINEDIFNKAGKTPPTTWDDLRVLARDLTVKDDQGLITQSGVALGRVENVDHWQEILALMMLQNGVDLTKPTGKPAEDALKFFGIFSNTDGVWDATLPPSTQAFAAGKLAMYVGPSWRSFEISQANPGLKFKAVPIPQLPKDSPNEIDITYATYWAEGVWTRSTKKAAAWDFLKFLSTKDSLQKLYQNESKLRTFGEPYSRVDMASLLTTHQILGAVVKQAPGAQSWYLASKTFDGPTGINSLLSKYFEDAVNFVISDKSADKALETAAQGVTQVLSQYRLTK